MPYFSAHTTPLGILTVAAAALLGLWLIFRSRRSGLRPRAVSIIYAAYLVGLAAVTMSANGSEPAAVAGVSLTETGYQMILAFRFSVPYQLTQYFLNILLFLPLGFLTPWIARPFRRWPTILALSFCLSGCIELLQYFSESNRVCDWADVICNTLGGLLGYAVHVLAVRRGRAPRWSRMLAAGLSAACLCLFLRPFLIGPDEIWMPDSRYGLPSKVTEAPGGLAADSAPGAVPVFTVRDDSWETSLDLLDAAGGISLWAPTAAEKVPQLLTPAGDVRICSAGEALQRAQAGVISSARADSFVGRTMQAEIYEAALMYDRSRDGSRLVPVWLLEGKITGSPPEDFVVTTRSGRTRQLTADEEQLLTDSVRRCALIVPAIA